MLLVKQPIKRFQSGAALIEFAIIVPLLLLLVVGIIEFGYAFYHLNILNKSVQDGARYFSDPLRARKSNSDEPIDVDLATNALNITNTKNLVIYGNTSGTGSQLLPDTAPAPTVYCAEENTSNVKCATTTNHIRVTAIYNHNFILGNALYNLTAGTIPSVYSLTASSVLRVE